MRFREFKRLAQSRLLKEPGLELRPVHTTSSMLLYSQVLDCELQKENVGNLSREAIFWKHTDSSHKGCKTWGTKLTKWSKAKKGQVAQVMTSPKSSPKLRMLLLASPPRLLPPSCYGRAHITIASGFSAIKHSLENFLKRTSLSLQGSNSQHFKPQAHAFLLSQCEKGSMPHQFHIKEGLFP